MQRQRPIKCFSKTLKKATYVLFFSALLVFSPFKADADTLPEHEITWAINAAPPFHVLNGRYKNQGICDALIQSVSNHLPNVKQRVVVMPQQRISQLMREQKQLCFPCMIYHPEANDGAVFSQPTHVYRPHGIITRRDIADKLLSDGRTQLSLAELLATDLRFGRPQGRKYGRLQGLIDNYDKQRNSAVLRSGENSTVGILDMIEAGRIDYTIDYMSVKTYYEKTHDDRLAYIPISELAQQPVIGAIGCSDDEWGRKSVALINGVLADVRRDQLFLQTLNLWFVDKPQDSYQRLYQQSLREYTPEE
ncbi:transporter substrate-binding domain-containing protein [Idiomarina xiamenensis]|uniref:Periplasmic substrate-binding protein n=1 Tax=Idiomarina xiamenensis 10-D-4 TaxID=740709 RepID=K2K925_9GAMM|nr:transporter substrate-binding domain-containing protein [Idiomarina xiamenensis]EKE84263.1 periplasmic substrate-binding protein [Idiomarina xiamenensis 10-D-4]